MISTYSYYGLKRKNLKQSSSFLLCGLIEVQTGITYIYIYIYIYIYSHRNLANPRSLHSLPEDFTRL